jgi:hypothetical protein
MKKLGVAVQLYVFLTLALDGDEWSSLPSTHLLLEKKALWYEIV